jgi:hypothetical protein
MIYYRLGNLPGRNEGRLDVTKRQSNRPDRRVAPAGSISAEDIKALAARVRYVGSGIHKLRPGDYGFIPSHNPRPSESPCDDIRPVLHGEASQLFRRGIALGMVSKFPPGGVPKYVWAIDGDNEVYEAKTKPERDADYHGYRLGDDDRDMRRYVLEEWRQRCRRS